MQSCCHDSAKRIRVRNCIAFRDIMAFYVYRDFQAGLRLRGGTTFTVLYLLIHLLPFAQTSPGKAQNQHWSSILIILSPSIHNSCIEIYIWPLIDYSCLHYGLKSHFFRDRKYRQVLCLSLRNTGTQHVQATGLTLLVSA